MNKITIADKPDIVPIAERYTRLRPSGKGLIGLCPIHQEKTPSFMVYPGKQYFRCYGCNAWGDVIGFIEQVEGLSFEDALRHLGIKTQRQAKPTSLYAEKKVLLGEVKGLYLRALYGDVLRLHGKLCASWLRIYHRMIANRYDFWWDDPELVAEHLPELLRQCETTDEAQRVSWWVNHALQCRRELDIIHGGTQAEKLSLYGRIIGEGDA